MYNLWITCAGAKNFDVVWLHNDKEIKPSKDFKYSSVGDKYSLEIAEIFPEDSGVYTCEAFNNAGEAFSTASLVVKGQLTRSSRSTDGSKEA